MKEFSNLQKTGKDEPSYLCRACSIVMCDDCKSMSEETETLFKARTHAIMNVDDEVKTLRRENESLKRNLAAYKEMLELGLPPLLKAWINSQTSQSLLDKLKKEVTK